MAASNTRTRYGTVAMVFHWLVALAILTNIPLGILANGAGFETGEDLARKAYLFSLHKTLGVWIFGIAAARILWACTQSKPAPLHPERRVETWLAGLVHWLLYASLVVVPLTGWIVHATTEGFAPLYGPLDRVLPDLPASEAVAGVAAALHIIFERVLVLSILLHVAGALKHHVFDRDATLRRMLPGRGEIEAGPGHATQNVPVFAALTVYAVAIGIGWGLGLFARDDTAPTAPVLAEVESAWAVEDGAISLAVQQFGNTVSGQFGDWTAEITFDPEPRDGVHGAVAVTIAVTSLTMGSVTTNVLGPEFFDTTQYPTATYEGPIRAEGDGYMVDGMLTIRDVALSVPLPFALQIDGDRAVMEGRAHVNRLEFGVGTTYDDATQVGFDVDIAVSLTARKTDP